MNECSLRSNIYMEDKPNHFNWNNGYSKHCTQLNWLKMSDFNLVLVMKTLSLKMPFYVSSCYVHMTYMPNDYYFRCTMVGKAVAPYFYMLNSLIFRKLRNDTCYIITIKVFMWVDRINCSCFHIKKKSNIKQVCLQDRLNLGMVKLN
jgi:hypothetical protein